MRRRLAILAACFVLLVLAAAWAERWSTTPTCTTDADCSSKGFTDYYGAP